MATVIALANQKGGVAKTTSCANIAAGLALRNFKTLLIDFDPQGNLSQFFGIQINDSEKPIVGDWILDRKTFDEVVLETGYPNLKIVPSNGHLKNHEVNMQNDILKALRYLEKKVSSIKDQFDFILIDTSPSISLLQVNGLISCDYVLVPAKLEYLSMKGLSQLNEKIQEISQSVKEIGILGIFGTFYRKSVKESENCLNELKKIFPSKMMNSIVHLNTRLAESASFSKPIQHFDKSCQGYTDYESLTQEVIEKCQKQTPAEIR